MLRLLTECFILLVGSAMFGATFNLVTRRVIHVSECHNFRKLKDSGLKINRLPLKIVLLRNYLQNSVNVLSKMVLKKLGFLLKGSKFCTFWTIRVASYFASM